MTADVSNAEILQMLKGMDQLMKSQDKRLDLFIEMMKDVPQDLKSLDNRLRHVENSIDGIRVSWNNRLIGSTLAVSAATAAAVAYLMVTTLI